MKLQMQPGSAVERIKANSMGGGLSNIKGASMTPAQNNPIVPVDPALQSKMGERVSRRNALQAEEIDIRDEDRRDAQKRIVRGEEDALARTIREEKNDEDRAVREEADALARIVRGEKNDRDDQIDAVEWERGRANRNLTTSTKKLTNRLTQQNLKNSVIRNKNALETRRITLEKEILGLKNSISTGDNQEQNLISISRALQENQKVRGSIEEKLAAGVLSTASDIYAADGDGADTIDEIIEQIAPGMDFDQVLQNKEKKAILVERLLHSSDPEFQFQSLKNEATDASKELQKESIKLLELQSKNSKGYDKSATQDLIGIYEGIARGRELPSELQKPTIDKSVTESIEKLNNRPPETGVNSFINEQDLDPSLESMIYEKLRSDGVIKNTPGSPEEKDLIPVAAFKAAMNSIQAQGKVPGAKENLSSAEENLDDARNPSSIIGAGIGLVVDGMNGLGELIEKAPDIPNAANQGAAVILGGFTGADLIKGEDSKLVKTTKAIPEQVNKLNTAYRESNVFGDESSKRNAVNKLNYDSGKGGAGPVSTPTQTSFTPKDQKWIKLNTELSQSHQSFARKNGLKEFKTPMPDLSEGSPAVNKWRTDLVKHYDDQAKLGRKSIYNRFVDKIKSSPKKAKYLGILGGTLLVDAAWTAAQRYFTDEDDPEIIELLNERNQMDEALKSIIIKSRDAEQEYINSISSRPEPELVEEPPEALPLEDSNSSVGSWLDSAVNLKENNTNPNYDSDGNLKSIEEVIQGIDDLMLQNKENQ